MPWPARMTGRFADWISAMASRMALDSARSIGCGRAARRRCRCELERRGGLLRILGDVDQHRAGPAGRGDLECLANRRRDVFGARDEEVVLGDRQRDAGDVDFLKGIGPSTFDETWPVMQTMGTESSIAVAMPVTRLVAPGPLVAMQTPTRPEARA